MSDLKNLIIDDTLIMAAVLHTLHSSWWMNRKAMWFGKQVKAVNSDDKEVNLRKYKGQYFFEGVVA